MCKIDWEKGSPLHIFINYGYMLLYKHRVRVEGGGCMHLVYTTVDTGCLGNGVEHTSMEKLEVTHMEASGHCRQLARGGGNTS